MRHETCFKFKQLLSLTYQFTMASDPILLLITTLLTIINHFTENMKNDQGDKDYECARMIHCQATGTGTGVLSIRHHSKLT